MRKTEKTVKRFKKSGLRIKSSRARVSDVLAGVEKTVLVDVLGTAKYVHDKADLMRAVKRFEELVEILKSES